MSVREKVVLRPTLHMISTTGTHLFQAVEFLQRVSKACYAERCTGYSKSVCLSVCPSGYDDYLSHTHTLALCQNDSN